MLSAFNELTVCVTNLSMASLENAGTGLSSFVTSEGGKEINNIRGIVFKLRKVIIVFN